MAVYKVPQDVEAEDKLVGPFTFRQFIYLLIAAGAGGLTFLFFRAPAPFPFFSILTVPIMIGFLVLALPLRKDQPMEIYLLAVLRFMFKPKKRVWSTDGVPTMVVIDAPKMIERHLTKDFSGEEASDRLGYLARIVDSRGWAAKGVDIPSAPAVSSVVVQDAANAEDVMDEDTDVARNFDALLAKQKEVSRSSARERMDQIAQGAPFVANNVMPPSFNAPAPTARAAAPPPPAPRPVTHGAAQHSAPAPQPVSTASTPAVFAAYMTPPVSPAIMNLANNKDLSIQAIAHEAERLARNDELEVEIPLR